MSNRLNTMQIWLAPVLLGVLSALGLTTALFSDSLGDLLAWLALSAPVAAVVWYALRRPTAGRRAAAPGPAAARQL